MIIWFTVKYIVKSFREMFHPELHVIVQTFLGRRIGGTTTTSVHINHEVNFSGADWYMPQHPEIYFSIDYCVDKFISPEIGGVRINNKKLAVFAIHFVEICCYSVENDDVSVGVEPRKAGIFCILLYRNKWP